MAITKIQKEYLTSRLNAAIQTKFIRQLEELKSQIPEEHRDTVIKTNLSWLEELSAGLRRWKSDEVIANFVKVHALDNPPSMYRYLNSVGPETTELITTGALAGWKRRYTNAYQALSSEKDLMIQAATDRMMFSDNAEVVSYLESLERVQFATARL